ncbi:hypothetical protein [Novosphingobium sp.]|uniref:hypothetical protein n=1 Tax=Novosphingobium sp. TaxID=1874826 RepID=UPI001ED61F89|nr:hypothetical protein [Novosphingobium sp.]MBK6800051.1 hypothetical protein [Novosphingobium sp.]MBK9010934.1 hypothetical protein [Novosphingobium sp.]
MRKLIASIAGAAVAAGLLAAPALQAKPRLTPEQRLEKLLAGRTAGEPVSCISTYNSRELEVLDKTALVFGHGNTIYVNRPANAADIDDDDILVTRTSTSQLCKLDIVTTVDRSGHFQTGFLNLGDFVPYKRIKGGN